MASLTGTPQQADEFQCPVLVRLLCPQDMHKRAWDLVHGYLSSNLEFFTGRAVEAESTTLPALTTWIRDTLADIPESMKELVQ